MPTTITVPGVAFAGAPLVARIPEGLAGYYNLGGAMSDTLVNHAGGADLAMVGSPVLSEGYASLKSLSAYFDTLIPETADFTHAVLWRPTGSLDTHPATAVAIGNYSNGTPGGVSIHAAGSPTMSTRMTASLTSGSTLSVLSSSTVSAEPNRWRLMVARFRTGVGSSLHDLTGSLSDFDASTLARALRPETLRIGSGVALLAGPCDVAAVQIYNRYLSDAEMAAGPVADLRMLAAEKSIAA